LWNHFRPRLEILEDRRMLACDMTVDLAGTLSVVGDGGDNRVELVGAEAVTPRGTERGVQVTCDGQTGTFLSVNAVAIYGMAGDDTFYDAHSHAIAEWYLDDPLNLFAPQKSYDGGEGNDALVLVGSDQLGEQFAINSGAEPGSVEVKVADRAMGTNLTSVTALQSELLTVKAGGGDDEVRLFTTDAAERIEVIGIPDPEIPDPLVRVTDLATNAVTFQATVVGAEEIDVEAGAADEFAADNRQGGLGKPILRFHFETVFTTKIDWSGPGDEGQEESITFVYGKMGVVHFVGGGLADRFDIRPGAGPGSFDLGAIDIQRGRNSFEAQVSGAELVTVDAGEGNDEFNVHGSLAAAVKLFGQVGNDICSRFGVEVGRGFGGGSLVYDGGEGEDRFQLIATDAAEQIEILGVEDRDVPDPLIRVTDLATGQVTELSIVNTEAIAVDSAGGNDRITMRDDQGPLANVNWTLIAGSGNDLIDAVLQSNPNEFFVEAGLGNDDVSIRFFGIPNIPEPNGPMPVIDVDMGAGVDGLLLDVFGSQTSPPVDFAAAGIAPSVTLLEVLTSIFISGVGLLSLLTLFPLGAMEMHQAIQDDRTGHVHETAAAIVLDAANFSADIQTGSTADEILIGLTPRPDSKVKVNVKSGDADDEVTVSTKEEEDDGDKGDQNVPAGDALASAAYELAFDLGGGNDKLDLASTTGAGPLGFSLSVLPGQFVLPEFGDKVVVEFDHGDIDKPFVLGTIWNTAPPPPNDPNSATPTPGKLMLGVQASGNQLGLDLDVLGSNGPDLLNVDTQLSDETIIYVLDISGSMSGGDDFYTYSHVEGPPVAVGSWILDASVDINMGSGNDRVAVALQPTSEESNPTLRIDTGDGDDLVDVKVDNPNANIPRNPCVVVGIDTGAGSDDVLVKVTGSFDEIVIGLLTGEGEDTIQFEAADLHLADGGHADWSFLDGGGQDALDLRLVDSSAGNDVKWDWTTGGGGGDDQIKVHIDEVLIGDRFLADWSLQGGEGDNHIDFVRCGMIVGADAIYSWSVGAGGGSDLLTVMLEDLAFGDGSVVKYLWNLGLGDDTAMTDASHIMLGMGTAFSWDITTGGLIGTANATDDDRFTATLNGMHLAEGSSFDWLLSTGDDLDTIDTRWTGPTLSPGERLPGLINLALDSGPGNDAVATSFLDVPFDVTLNAAAGAGDDVIDTKWTGPTLIPDAPCIIVGIDAGLGSDAVTFMADGAWEEIDASILTGDGADQVFVGISNTTPTEGGEEPEPPDEFRSRAAVSLRTGDRNDTVMTSFDVFGDSSLDIDTGTGDDTLNTIYIGSANGGVWKTTNSMGEGDDTAMLAISPRDPASGLAESFFDVFFDLGSGDDTLDTRWTGPTLSPGKTSPGLINLVLESGPGNDSIGASFLDVPFDVTMNIAAGDGDDVIDTRWTGPTLIPGTPCIIVGIDTGLGNDAVTFVTAGAWEDLDGSIHTGDGTDGVDVLLRRLANPHLPDSEPSGLDELEIVTGTGNDAIDVQLESAAASAVQKVHVDSGDGDDRVQVSAPQAARDGLADLIVGTDAGIPAHVKVFDGITSAETSSSFPYGGFSGGVRVASADVTGDDVADIITAAGPGAGPHVKVFDGATGAEVRSFFAYGTGFLGGVQVAGGDVNGDGRADIIVGAGPGATGGHVKVFDGRTGAELQSFFAFPGFAGGVTVAAGDVNRDGAFDIIVGAGPGAPGGHVKVFDGRTGSEIHSFLSFPGFSGGVFVAAGDVDGDGFDDIITGTDAGAPGGHVKVFSGVSGAELASFFAYGTGFVGGVRVAAGDVNGDGFADIVAGAGPGAGPHVKVFDGRTGAELQSFFAFDPSFSGGVFVAAADLHSSARPVSLDLDLAIGTGAGRDAVQTGLSAFADELLQKVRVSTGAGNDSVVGHILPYLEQDNLYQLQTDLGAGKDIARYWVFGTELPPAVVNEQLAAALGRLELEVRGGLGADVIQGRIGTNPAGQSRPLALGQTLLDIDGGAGHDRIWLDFKGTIFDDESVQAILHGNVGNDLVRARFELGVGSTGKLSAQVFGDAGNDDLGLAILGSDQLDEFFALLDGGKGRDKCRVTRNVIVRNCESIQRV
jgi:hypothetical protein